MTTSSPILNLLAITYSPSVQGGTRQKRLSALLCGLSADFFEIKSIVDALLISARIEYEVLPYGGEILMGGRSADIVIKGRVAGYLGEVHHRILNNYGIDYPCTGLELSQNL